MRGALQVAAGGALTAGALYHAYVADVRATRAYGALAAAALPALRALDAEDAHTWGVRAAAAGLAPRDGAVDCGARRAALGSTVAGLAFRAPVGLAAGFDKQADAPGALLAAGLETRRPGG
jgi:hypothetical protein